MMMANIGKINLLFMAFENQNFALELVSVP